MPLRISSDLTAAGTTSPVVSTDLVVHLPDEIMAIAAQIEREGGRLLVCCRSADQAMSLADQLLEASVGSAVVTSALGADNLAATLEAFRFGDFTVLLVSDEVRHPFRVDAGVHLLHADLPTPHGGIQLMGALNNRRARLSSVEPPLIEAQRRSTPARINP